MKSLNPHQISSIRIEYCNLCRVSGAIPLPLDIYVWIKDSNDFTEFKTPIKNATPLYTEDKIIIPVVDASDVADVPVSFPPESWKTRDGKNWPSWRTDLWHEFLHQIENKILNIWRPGEDNQELMCQAEEYLAKKLGVTVDVIKQIK